MSFLQKILGVGRSQSYDSGIKCYDDGRFEDALKLFEHALTETRDVMVQKLARFYIAESHAQLGQAALRRGQYEIAAEHFQRALEIHPHYADLHFSLAFALRKLREYERAEHHLKQALQINPRFAKAVLYQGILWYETGRREEGLRRVVDALVLDTTHDRARYEQALEHDRAGRFDQTIALLETLSSNSTDDALYHARLGDDLYRKGDFTGAVAEYRKALAIRPNFADIRNHLGMALAALGNEEEAIQQFLYALEINPRYLDARLNLAITLRDSGRHAEAREHFQTALDIDPENAVARNALRDLAA